MTVECRNVSLFKRFHYENFRFTWWEVCCLHYRKMYEKLLDCKILCIVQVHVHCTVYYRYLSHLLKLFKKMFWNSSTDVDECTTKPDICGIKGGKCVNKFGSYFCVCEKGFKQLGDKTTPCSPIDFCLKNAKKCGTRAECISTTEGYECRCKPGFRKNNRGYCDGKDMCCAF